MEAPGQPQPNTANPPRPMPRRPAPPPRRPDQPPQRPQPPRRPDQPPRRPDQPPQRPPQPPPPPPKPRKVFLNYRADELPIIFMESLMMRLGKEEISIFIERDELMGRELPHPFTRIVQSNVALAIFSKRYAESEWCMEELVKMKERVNQTNLVVIPVFYEVSKGDVLTRSGEFGHHFAVTRQRYEDDPEKIQRWENSLTSIAGDGDIYFRENGNISDLVDDIIREVKVKLNMPTYWPAERIFFMALAVCIAVASLRPPNVKFSAEWVFGFPVFVALVWQIVCHGKTRMDYLLLWKYV